MKVSIGPTTIGGVLVAIAGFATAAIVALAEGGFPLSSKWAAIVGTVSMALTQLGRYLQGVQLAKKAK